MGKHRGLLDGARQTVIPAKAGIQVHLKAGPRLTDCDRAIWLGNAASKIFRKAARGDEKEGIQVKITHSPGRKLIFL